MRKDREDEQFAKAAFDNYLRVRLGIHDIEWDDESEAPDCVLIAQGEQYAVEITQIYEDADTKPGRKWTAVEVDWRKLAAEVQQAASVRGILTGYYGIHAYRPLPKSPKELEKIKAQLLVCIAKTQLASDWLLEELDGLDDSYCGIVKISYLDAKVEVCSYLEGGFVEEEAQKEAMRLLENCLKCKQGKLRHVPSPKILLIIDHFPHVSSGVLKICWQAIKEDYGFHSVFVIPIRGTDFMLFTRNQSWAGD